MSLKIEATIRVAQAIERSSSSNQCQPQRTLEEAQACGINMFDSLRAHILLRVAEGNPQVVSSWLCNSESCGSS
jgi:hypothetical protein